MNIQDKLEDLIQLIEQAGNTLREMYKIQDLEVEMKPDATPVTEADKLSNRILSTGIKKLFPDIPMISEESDIPSHSIRSKWKNVWIIDPLDGTKEFIYKNGRFCINIALIKDNIPVFGMINNIQDQEIVWAFRNEKCYIKKEGAIREVVPEIPTTPKLRIAVSRFNMTEAEFEYIDYLQTQGYIPELIPLGASSKQCAVALGRADICPKFGKCYEWDIAAGQIIIESAGGMVVNTETFVPPEYNKKELASPAFLMFSKKWKEEIEDGNKIFTNYKNKQ